MINHQSFNLEAFVLGFFARSGAKVTLQEDLHVWTASFEDENGPPEGWTFPSPFRFTFRKEARLDDVHLMVLGSDYLKQIMAECRGKGVVTYRHLASKSLPSLDLFRQNLKFYNCGPVSMHCGELKTHGALCFVHMITYESSALGTRQEEIFVDVLDAETRERNDYLSSQLFHLVTIPCLPSGTIAEAEIDRMVSRARFLAESRAKKRGGEMEGELTAKLNKEVNRVETYYAQLAEKRREKEAALLERIEGLEKKLEETKGPATQLKLREEIDGLWVRVTEMNEAHEAEIAVLQEASAAKSAHELNRHELEVAIELVNISYLTYDAVPYTLELRSPDGKTARMPILYLPITGEIRLSPCPCCQQMASEIAICACGSWGCTACLKGCTGCRAITCPTCTPAHACMTVTIAPPAPVQKPAIARPTGAITRELDPLDLDWPPKKGATGKLKEISLPSFSRSGTKE